MQQNKFHRTRHFMARYNAVSFKNIFLKKLKHNLKTFCKKLKFFNSFEQLFYFQYIFFHQNWLSYLRKFTFSLHSSYKKFQAFLLLFEIFLLFGIFILYACQFITSIWVICALANLPNLSHLATSFLDFVKIEKKRTFW